MQKRKSLQTLAMVGGATLLMLWLAWLSISSQTFVTSDTGLRWLQIQSLIENRWQTFAIDYPARIVDPDFQFVPYYNTYRIFRDNEVFVTVSPYFPLLASWLYAWLGLPGLPIVPALAGVLTALAVFQLARLANLPQARLAFWATLFATPVLFYSLTLWDHTLTVALGTWGVYGAARGLARRHWPSMVWGGFLLGLGMGQRPELYTLTLAVGLSWLMLAGRDWKRTLALVGGGLAGVAPMWWLQYRWYGHPLAPSMAANLFGYGNPAKTAYVGGESPPLLMRKGFLLTYIVPRDPVTFAATLLLVVGIGLLILSLRTPRWASRRNLLASAALLLGGHAVFGAIGWQGIISGLLPTFPLLGLALAYPRPESTVLQSSRLVYRFVFGVMALFLALMLLLWPAFGGLQWGARYLLPAYPLMIFTALWTVSLYVRRLPAAVRPAFAGVTVALLAASVLLQILGVRQLYLSHRAHRPVLQAMQALPADFVLTDKPFFPAQMAASGKAFIYVANQSQAEMMLARLAEAGVSRTAVIKLGVSPYTLPNPATDIIIETLGP